MDGWLSESADGCAPFTWFGEWNQEEYSSRTSLVAHWLRILLPMQGTRVQVLVREDPTCRRATKPVHHNY
ncbi:hypothetical protein J1605_020681 [Eschrichtius robustus]|uniref:Uncharacterized protein n=1 Tax=Eschrichtius robustus TaxID=9764 RepID=A0AB34HJS0_ESCRO|nr:hypothetical protein J1605_020681 [Eschrichtius robustus]